MKLNNIKSLFVVSAIAATTLSSCMKDLDKAPIDPTIDTDLSVQGLYNKCYAGLIMEGNDGAADFSIDDAGKSTLLRNLFNFNCLSTDEAICWWSDGGIENVCNNDFAPGNATLKNLYYRLMSNITYCNHFLGLDACKADKAMYAEVRFLRAYYYYQLTDFFGNVPFLEEISSSAAPQKDRAFMFAWVEKELLAAEADMLEAKPKTSADANYGRADKAAAWLMLSRLYLNSSVWLNTSADSKDYMSKAAEYAKMAKDAYPLFTGNATCTKDGVTYNYTAYDMLFMGDNGENGASREAILPLLQDGLTTRGWGGSLFFIAAMWNADMRTVTDQDAGTTANNWSGMRMRPELIAKFVSNPTDCEGKTTAEIRSLANDDRALFWGVDHTVSLGDNSSFTQGIATTKWNNNYSTGKTAHDTYDVDTDFFLLRAAEAYLNYAEALMRNSGGCPAEAKSAIDAVRSRAHASVRNTYTLDDVLDERAREFYCEGYRRTDLIRFGQFGGSQATYKWTGKGGSENGVNFPAAYNIYPIPTSELSANENLKQNDGY